MKQKGFTHIFLLAIITLIGIGTIGYFAYKNAHLNKNNVQIVNSPMIASATPTGISKSYINDGQYINEEFGFKFKYPTDIFVNFSKSSDKYADFTSDDSQNLPIYNLHVDASDSISNKSIFYSDYNLAIGVPKYTSNQERELKLLHNYKVVKKYTISGYPTFIVYSYITPSASDFEPSFGHQLSILKNNKILVRFNLFSPGKPDGTKNERLTILNNIANSFEFLVPTDHDPRCDLTSDSGPCKASIGSYFWNKEYGSCDYFSWGGCQGVRPFETKDECELACKSYLQ